jgi:hypothetical protein
MSNLVPFAAALLVLLMSFKLGQGKNLKNAEIL